jgi:tetratricopeptide (TPR) repeat protein
VADWYRNTHWDAEIEAAFEAKLARVRAQKAQYLRIQGSTLKDRHPEVAVRLLSRCAEAGEPMFVAQALLDKAHAQYRMGEVDDALDTLEAAIAQQKREPRFQTSASFDYPFLVAFHDRTERFDRALALLEGQEQPLFPDQAFAREAARAIILLERGDEAQSAEAARQALHLRGSEGWIPGFQQVGAVPATEHPFIDRLRAIAAQSG